MGTNGRVCLGLNVGGISMIGVFVFQMNKKIGKKKKKKIDIFISLVVVLVPVLSCLVSSRLAIRFRVPSFLSSFSFSSSPPPLNASLFIQNEQHKNR